MTKRPLAILVLLLPLACSTGAPGPTDVHSFAACGDPADGGVPDSQPDAMADAAPELQPDLAVDMTPDQAEPDAAAPDAQEPPLEVLADGPADPCSSGPIVEVAPGQNLQTAITGAAQGSVVHVQAGSYSAFTVHDKWLSICCEPGAVITGSNAMTASTPKTLAQGMNTVRHCEWTGGSPGLLLKGYQVWLDRTNAHHNPGGGVFYGGSNGYPLPPLVTMTKVKIDDHATARGIVAGPTETVISESFIRRNNAGSAAGSDGGGFHFTCGKATITNTLFEGNSAFIGGAGAMTNYNCATPAKLIGSGNTVRGNTCVKHTGGMFSDGAEFVLDHEQATGNPGGTEGGGAYGCDGSTNPGNVKVRGKIKCTNCSVTANGVKVGATAYPGGGFLLRATDAACDIELKDSIVWGNVGTDLGSISGSGGTSSMTATHVDWATWLPVGAAPGWTHIMDLNVDPLWVAPGAAPPDLHLQTGSPVSAAALTPAPGLGVYP